MTKKSTSFYLSDEAKQQLKMLAEKENRSQANMLEVIVQEYFTRYGLTLPTKPAKKKS